MGELTAGTGFESNGVYEQALFVDAAKGDFRLLSRSPGIDAGAVIVGFNDPGSAWPLSGSAPDLGAFENVSGPGSTPLRSGGGPSGVLPAGTASVTLVVATDSVADCRYSATGSVTYAEMASTFANTGSTVHTTTVSGLSDGTAHSYYVRCKGDNAAVNQADYELSFSITAVDVSPPVISDIAVVRDETSATIAWTTDDGSTSQVGYGTSTSSLDLTEQSAVLVTSHSLQPTGLTSGTTYYYQIQSCNIDGFCSITPIGSFSTLLRVDRIFADNFETGDTALWTSSALEADNLLEVVPGAASEGTFGLRILTAGTNDDANLQKEIPGTSDIYTRGRVKLVANVSQNNHQFFLAAATNSWGSYVGGLAIRNQSGDPFNNLYTFAGGSFVDSGVDLGLNISYCVEMRVTVSPSAGRIQAWVDGVQVEDRQGVNTGSTPINWLRLGPDGASATSEYYFDDFKADSVRIGCAGAPSAPPPPPPNTPPTATITGPTDGSTFLTSEVITLSGSGNDAEDGALAGASLVWTSDLDAQIGTGATFMASLSAGIHTITLTASDSPGATGTGSVAVTVNLPPPPNAAPTASITGPADGSTFLTTEVITLSGSGNDAEDGALAGASLVWTSDLDAQIGTGATFSASLSAGIHTITLTATDSPGATGTDSVSVTVNLPPPPPNTLPTASITGPADGSTFLTTEVITLSGSGNDAEDGASAGASLVWRSDLDAQIGTGATFTASLSAGIHTITLTATDSLAARPRII